MAKAKSPKQLTAKIKSLKKQIAKLEKQKKKKYYYGKKRRKG